MTATLPIPIIAQQFADVVIPLIESAEESISIIVFDWRFYPTISGSPVSRFNASVLAAAARGVDVKALVNNDDVLTRLRGSHCEARRLHSSRLMHTKLLIVDGRKVVIGSHNYTQSGLSANHEASVLVDMVDKDNQFVSYFNALWGV